MWRPEPAASDGYKFRDLLEHIDQIKLDIAEVYRVDLDDPDEYARHGWHWWSARIAGLITMPPVRWASDGKPLPANRLQWALRPPT